MLQLRNFHPRCPDRGTSVFRLEKSIQDLSLKRNEPFGKDNRERRVKNGSNREKYKNEFSPVVNEIFRGTNRWDWSKPSEKWREREKKKEKKEEEEETEGCEKRKTRWTNVAVCYLYSMQRTFNLQAPPPYHVYVYPSRSSLLLFLVFTSKRKRTNLRINLSASCYPHGRPIFLFSDRALKHEPKINWILPSYYSPSLPDARRIVW